MKYLFLILFGSVVLGGMNSCSTDVDINAPWKDITVVYGLMNQNDSIHYIKVNKSFLGDASAYEMAAVSDSVHYKDLYVKLYKVKTINGTSDTVATITFKDTILDKDSGIFATDDNIVFYSTQALINSSEVNNIEDYRFDLNVYIPQFDKTVTGSTSLISKLLVSKPNSYQPTINLSGLNGYDVEWKSTAGAKLYQSTLGFHYYEMTSTDTTTHYIEYPLPTKKSQTIEGGEDMKETIIGNSFFEFLSNKLVKDEGIQRMAMEQTFDFIFIVGSADLNTYIEVSSPSNGIVQEKPAYTNINNGIGLFTSRYDKTIYGKEIAQKCIDSLAISNVSKDLNFQNSQSTYDYWANVKAR